MAYYCPKCGEVVKNSDRFCPNCGEPLVDGAVYAESEDDLIDMEDLRDHTNVQTVGNYQYQRQQHFDYSDENMNRNYEYTENNYYQSEPRYYLPLKNKTVAGILGIVGGGLGLHHFYLGNIAYGVLSILFAWSGVPHLIGLIQGIIYLTQSDEEFCLKNHCRVK